MRLPRARVWSAVAAAAAALAGPFAAAAEEEAPAPAAEPAPQSPPPVGLDRLLKLPSDSAYGVERRGGLTRGEWRQRFVRVEGALAEERQGLAAAQGELDKVAGSATQWLVGPPGTTNTEAPLDYRLRQEIKRRKEEIERLEKSKTDLDVEANLAGVPADWRAQAP